MDTAPHFASSAPRTKPKRLTRKRNGRDDTSAVDGIAAMFRTLDRLLGLAVDKTARLLGPATLLDPWRGMHLNADEVRRALEHGHPAALTESGAAERLSHCLLQTEAGVRLRRVMQLDLLDLAIVAIALAPDIDLRYERIYAYLQDDISRKRPSPDLIANLLCTSASERLQMLVRFEADSPLMRHGLLLWCKDAGGSDIAQPLRVSREWIDVLTGRSTFHTKQAAEMISACERAAIDPDVAVLVEPLLREARAGRTLRLILQGPHGAGKQTLARGIAQALRVTLIRVDLRDCTSTAELQSILKSSTNIALARGGLLYLHGAGRLQTRDLQLVRTLQSLLADQSLSFILALSAPLPFAHGPAVSAQHVELHLPSPSTRRMVWSAALQRHAVAFAAAEIDAVAARFILSGAQIEQAASDVAHRLRRDGNTGASVADLAAAARALCGSELAQMAQRVRAVAGFDSLVATSEVQAQLREICACVKLREQVRRCWIGNSVHGRNVGVNALFAGPSGTGKTLAAEVVACELGLDLFRIDLSAVVSKYIGETEKNLDRVFAAATNANAVLFFDEADALFGKRSEVKDAHDRYANIEIAYLLQKIEQFDGVAILATNLKQNLDEAFTRRLTFCVNFAFPEEAERVRLWQTLWPAAAPRAPEVDFAALAREYRFSGGNIRNIVVASTYLAAADGGIVTREHVRHAARREFQKLGKTIGVAEHSMRHAA